MIRKDRIFDGKKYKAVETDAKTKPEASKRAVQVRKQGHKVRIIKIGKKWVLYVR